MFFKPKGRAFAAAFLIGVAPSAGLAAAGGSSGDGSQVTPGLGQMMSRLGLTQPEVEEIYTEHGVPKGQMLQMMMMFHHHIEDLIDEEQEQLDEEKTGLPDGEKQTLVCFPFEIDGVETEDVVIALTKDSTRPVENNRKIAWTMLNPDGRSGEHKVRNRLLPGDAVLINNPLVKVGAHMNCRARLQGSN